MPWPVSFFEKFRYFGHTAALFSIGFPITGRPKGCKLSPPMAFRPFL